MQIVSRSRWIPYSPDEIYEALTKPDDLPLIVKRIDAMKVLSHEGNRGQVEVRIDLPGGKWVDVIGEVEGQPGKGIQFRAERPFPITNTWSLTPEERGLKVGTLATMAIELDLSPLIAFWSNLLLRGYLSSELDGDLLRLETWMSQRQPVVN
jgi:ribosome-associated toxin RatA of RatAB toxin-antitoxin module